MEPFVGEIRAFAGNFAPKGWALCNGQLLPIMQNTALFSLLGVTYGGDGRTTFALPNLMGRAPMQQGQGAGLTLRQQGAPGGTPSVTLLTSEIPMHTHVPANATSGTTGSPENAVWAGVVQGRSTTPVYSPTPNAAMNPAAVSPAGGSQPHNNMQPYLGVNFIIALQGVFPSRP
ncbi:phage tail protein [Paenibacillus soyae]|uniref:Tail fiber protein n=1 Tax=Paenibacillus soyae TaxID=2969249 RepID=A0A9X2SAT3_9BACL|nr:tail fiber protein [Paenibacillus soyae]MCR2806631.1 tail fiber protein [Paenibacillus soyae]